MKAGATKTKISVQKVIIIQTKSSMQAINIHKKVKKNTTKAPTRKPIVEAMTSRLVKTLKITGPPIKNGLNQKIGMINIMTATQKKKVQKMI
jgi:hypothetical protein